MTNLINGRTPKQIKTGLSCSGSRGNVKCSECAYCMGQFGDEDCNYECDQIDNDALALIERLESERDAVLAKVPGWISVEEKTPKDRQIVYMHTSNGRTFKGIYLSHTGFERYKHGDGWMLVKNVTHWTTLPELPEVKSK